MGFLERCSLIRLDHETVIPHFDCGDEDLNDYIRSDAFEYNKKLLAVTNLVFSGADLAAFYSVSNDKISQQDGFSNRSYDRFRRAKLDTVRTRSFPGVKIGRFAVSTQFKNMGIGRELLDYIKMHFLDNNKTGCRFITVDAYITSIEFYQKNDFVFLTDSDKDDPHTRLMFFDLARLV